MVSCRNSMVKPLALLRHFVTSQSPMVDPGSFLVSVLYY